MNAIKNDPANPDNNPDRIDWTSKKADRIDPTVLTLSSVNKFNAICHKTEQ